MDSIAKFISPERDAFYLIGREKAEERFVRNLLAKLSLTTEQIADLAGVSVDFVKAIEHKVANNQ